MPACHVLRLLGTPPPSCCSRPRATHPPWAWAAPPPAPRCCRHRPHPRPRHHPCGLHGHSNPQGHEHARLVPLMHLPSTAPSPGLQDQAIRTMLLPATHPQCRPRTFHHHLKPHVQQQRERQWCSCSGRPTGLACRQCWAHGCPRPQHPPSHSPTKSSELRSPTSGMSSVRSGTHTQGGWWMEGKAQQRAWPCVQLRHPAFCGWAVPPHHHHQRTRRPGPSGHGAGGRGAPAPVLPPAPAPALALAPAQHSTAHVRTRSHTERACSCVAMIMHECRRRAGSRHARPQLQRPLHALALRLAGARATPCGASSSSVSDSSSPEVLSLPAWYSASSSEPSSSSPSPVRSLTVS